ncbi:MAG: aldo/keto reductase [Calditrichaceae bacterium]|nr:aldo/keto reductase [Calditrichaceae bacterium]MBN2710414.1 aldo/keto reductase [Calditrichaceae bacterium]RQV94590.1 MAG: aldo/keto reductase [Calditrichota bacterium]
MEYRNFAKTDIQLSRLGFGAWGIGKTMWIGAEDKESKKVLRKAIDAGINFFDSALVYGNGHSEKLLGEVEKEAGQELFITSKIPPKNYKWPAPDDSKLTEAFPKNHIIQQTERSLRNMNREYIDLQQFHVWNDKWADNDEWKDAFYQLKKDGKVRYAGISVNDHQPENAIETGKTGLIDSFQVIFNIFDQSPADKLFPFCLENKISIIARVPFDEGSLAGAVTSDTEFPKGDFRNNYFRGDRKKEVWERAQKIRQAAGKETESIAETALRYVISFDAVTTVIPGMRKEKNLLANLKSGAKGPLSADLLEELKAHRWIRNFYR